MTSASELFYTRRSRVGRDTTSAENELGFESPIDRNLHHNFHRRYYTNHNNSNNNRHNLDACDPLLRRSPPLRRPCNRVSLSVREPVHLGQSSGLSGSGNRYRAESSSSGADRPRLDRNDRLPGAVLLARERLLERLRAISVSGNRRSSRASSGNYNDEFTMGNDFGLVDGGDWETEIPREWLVGDTPHIDLTSHSDWMPFIQESNKRKPPGLSREASDCLCVEIFNDADKDNNGDLSSRASQECSICLESFLKYDELICLPCGHRFHSKCLLPWVRECGDCPYCRTGIAVSNHKALYS
ncbi:Zinc finger, RING-type [Dillenia turbinata]|uniref:Zinc finger, RING-type n=1 Tax=Dillenia turbinata TaxID=194707 RepID=A0AAN8WCX3_9MAGN